MPRKFTSEFRDRAVRMVLDPQVAEGGPRAASIRVVTQSLGCGPETLRNWCRGAETADHEPVASIGEASLEEGNRRLRRELAEARRANEILKQAPAFFAAELDGPTTR